MSEVTAEPSPPGLEAVTAVVLAAGTGSRFEGPVHKLLQPLAGRPLVVWAVAAAREAGCAEVVVVEGAVALGGVLPRDVVVVRNPAFATGQASSLRCALDWCLAAGRAAAVVGLGDQPFVPPAAWRAVAACTAAPIVAARYGGRRRNPVRLSRPVWPLLPSTGDEGARVLMAARPELVAEVACEGEPLDVDTADDLAVAEGAAVAVGPPRDDLHAGPR